MFHSEYVSDTNTHCCFRLRNWWHSSFLSFFLHYYSFSFFFLLALSHELSDCLFSFISSLFLSFFLSFFLPFFFLYFFQSFFLFSFSSILFFLHFIISLYLSGWHKKAHIGLGISLIDESTTKIFSLKNFSVFQNFCRNCSFTFFYLIRWWCWISCTIPTKSKTKHHFQILTFLSFIA